MYGAVSIGGGGVAAVCIGHMYGSVDGLAPVLWKDVPVEAEDVAAASVAAVEGDDDCGTFLRLK